MNLSVGSTLERKSKEEHKKHRKVDWKKASASPRLKMFDKSYLEIESALKEDVKTKLAICILKMEAPTLFVALTRRCTGILYLATKCLTIK